MLKVSLVSTLASCFRGKGVERKPALYECAAAWHGVARNFPYHQRKSHICRRKMNELAWRWVGRVGGSETSKRVLRTGSSPIRLHDCHPHPRCSRWYKLEVLRLVLFVAACVLFGVSLDFIFHSPASKAGDVRSFPLAHEGARLLE